MAKRVARIGDTGELAGVGRVLVVRIAVGDYRYPDKRYVRLADPDGAVRRLSLTEAAFLKIRAGQAVQAGPQQAGEVA